MSACIIYSRARNFSSESSSQIREFGRHFFSHRSNLEKKKTAKCLKISHPDLQHKGYKNNFVTDIWWKEIAGELS
jgi:hypothetical protein